MCFQKFKSNSNCFGRRHRPATINFYGDMTSKGSKILIAYCSKCKRQKSTTVSDNTTAAEVLGGILKSLGNKENIVTKKMAKNVLQNPGRALHVLANITSAVATRNPKAASSTLPERIKCFHAGKRFCLGNFKHFMLYKWNKKHQSCIYKR